MATKKTAGITAPQQKTNEINNIASNTLVLPPAQQSLFHVEKQVEFQEVEMGVLESGVPYLSGRGLAKMCGIDHKTLHEISADWNSQKTKPRGKQINQLLEQSGYYENELYLKAEFNGTEVNAYTEPVCLAILEYYAFLADDKKEKATQTFRILARIKFGEFIYQAVGYAPTQKNLDSWKHFHDRIDMTQDAAPIGYWGVFREIAVMIVPMIRSGIIISDKVVPDISVGKAWSTFWKENNCDEQFGARTHYDHEYPSYYPQSKTNPQSSFAYPNAALGMFRNWLQQNYILTKFPAYLLGQTKKGTLQIEIAHKAIETFTGKAIAAPVKEKAKIAAPKQKS
ncbi:MAG: hypothetical protein ACKO0Z_16675 [Betaproteobacteria bacterium]